MTKNQLWPYFQEWVTSNYRGTLATRMLSGFTRSWSRPVSRMIDSEFLIWVKDTYPEESMMVAHWWGYHFKGD